MSDIPIVQPTRPLVARCRLPHLLAWLTVLVVLLCLLSTRAEAGVFGRASDAVTKRSTDEQIHFLRGELQKLRAKDMNPALNRLYTAEAALTQAKKREGFFYTKPEDKARIRVLDEEYRRSLVEVQILKEQENMMLAQLKPLYGVLSTQFAQEQKESIASAISTVQQMSYDNAWYSSLFSVGEAESLSDLVVGFLVKWVVGYVVLYPFAVLYYAIFVAPWSVYQYMSGVTDIIPAVAAYLVAVGVMCLPFVALVGGLYLVYRKYEPRLRASMDEARRRQEWQQHHHRD